jgi:hypothetical protein
MLYLPNRLIEIMDEARRAVRRRYCFSIRGVTDDSYIGRDWILDNRKHANRQAGRRGVFYITRVMGKSRRRFQAAHTA